MIFSQGNLPQNENPLNVEIVLGGEPDPTQHSLVTM